jgi:thiosulfate reductase cytochrome b subunit
VVGKSRFNGRKRANFTQKRREKVLTSMKMFVLFSIVVLYVVTNVSNGHNAFIYRVKYSPELKKKIINKSLRPCATRALKK